MGRWQVVGLVLVTIISAILVDSAGAETLLDVLHEKGVVTDDEYRRLHGGDFPPSQTRDLIELLRAKGVLSPDEAKRLAQPSPPPAEKKIPLETAKPAAEGAPATPAVGYDEGFFVRSPGGDLVLKFNGRVASNFRFSEPNTTLPNTVTIDRARLGVDATFYKRFRLRLENDFTSSSGLRDAFFVVSVAPALNIEIGQFKVPFSYEELLSKKYIDFVERAAVVNAAVNPSRDIGVMAYGQLGGKLLQYQAAVMNGTGQNRSDNNGAKDVAARLVVSPFVAGGPPHLAGLNAGGAVTWGRQARETTKLPDGTTQLVATSIAGTTETGFTFLPAVARRGDRLRAGGHIAWLDGPYSFSAEYIHTEEKRQGLGADGADLPDFDTEGAYVGGTWLLTGEKKPANARNHPARALWDSQSPGFGAWEVAARWEFFKLRHGADSPGESDLENRYDAALAGVNWYPNEFLRFSLNYVYGHFEDRGTGRAPNPEKHSNSAVLARGQLEF